MLKSLVKTVILVDTQTKNIIGAVVPMEPVDYLVFYGRVLHAWKEFDAVKQFGYSIETFVDYYNEIYKMQIDYALADHILL